MSGVTDLNTLGNPNYDPTLYTEYTPSGRIAARFFQDTTADPITLGIAIPSREVPVRKPSVGDMVLTRQPETRPIVWIGHG